MKVIIETILHTKQRYDTCGDWWWEGTSEAEVLQMRISNMGDWRKEMCVAYHELFEALECKAKNITQAQVDAFDMVWVQHDDIDEPGDDPAAPYYYQHQHAKTPEFHLANFLGLSWAEYEEAIFNL